MQIRLTVRDVRRVNNDDGSQYGELARLQSLEGSDNASWAVETTPSSASLELYITNPAAFGTFTPGSECEFAVLEPAPVEAPAAPVEAPTSEPAQGA